MDEPIHSPLFTLTFFPTRTILPIEMAAPLNVS